MRRSGAAASAPGPPGSSGPTSPDNSPSSSSRPDGIVLWRGSSLMMTPARARGAAAHGHRSGSGRHRRAAGRRRSGSGDPRAGRRGRPWLPRTSVGSSGITSKRVRKPSFFCSSRRMARPCGQSELRVEEELARVVAGLAVDVDGPGEVGGLAVVEPVGIGEPGVGLGQGDELARPRMIEADLARARRRDSTRATPGSPASRSRTRGAVGGSRT